MRPVNLLIVLPFLGFLGGVFFADRVHPFVLGLPFLGFWCALWVVITSVVMFVIYRSDPRNRGGEDQ